jgi:hypothetical protein
VIDLCPVVSSIDDNGTQRITLLDADDSELCGVTSRRVTRTGGPT